MITILIGSKDGQLWKYHVNENGELTEFSEEEMRADRAESKERWEKTVADILNNATFEQPER